MKKRSCVASLCVLVVALTFAACGGGGGGGGGGSGCENGITGYYLVNANACAYGTLNSDYFYVSQEGSSVSAYASYYGTFTGTIDSSCNLSLSINVTRDGNTYNYGCSGAWTEGALNLNCDDVDTSTGDVTGQCAYNSQKVVGSGCENGVTQGYYYASSASTSCSASPVDIYQNGSSIYFNQTGGYIDDECVISLSDGAFGAYFDGFIVMLTSGGCLYGIEPVTGSGCSSGIAQGPYNLESSQGDCESFGAVVAQNGNEISIGDMSGYIDAKCAIMFPAESCVGAYTDGTMTMVCPSCYYSINPITTTTRWQLGLYDLGQDPWPGCEAYSLGDPARFFFTDAYVDVNGSLVLLTDTSKFEADDAGGNNLFSTAFNSDYTMQFPYKDQTATAVLSEDFRFFQVDYAPAACNTLHYTRR